MNRTSWFNYTLFIINLVLVMALSITGYWILIFIPSIIISYFLRIDKARWAFTYMAMTSLVGVLIAIVINPYFFYNGEVAAAIIGLPQVVGSIVLLVITLIIALVIGGLGGLIGHYVRTLSRRH